MRYFKAFETIAKPLIIWNLWADSLEKLTEMGEDDNPLILPEDDVPATVYGVCPLKIVDGELVNRTSLEMSEFETEYGIEKDLIDQFSLLNFINTGTFDFDFGTFPMDERSRLLYDALNNTTTAIPDTLIMNFEGKPYTLTNANKTGFLEAYYAKLLLLSTPNFAV
ncbi:hypothetical protein [Flavobacterium sp.]|uniref:hypothetical protein n=1 Tax=Flavobacterium sp. TaxID=239 RepID=UPI0040481421